MVALNGSVLSLTQILVWLVIALICGAAGRRGWLPPAALARVLMFRDTSVNADDRR